MTATTKDSLLRRSLPALEVTFIIAVTALALIPFIWLVLTAFKERTDILSPDPKLFFSPTWSNFYEAFVAGEFDRFLRNSLIVACGSVAICLLTGLPAAYAFSRFRVFGEKHLFFYVLTTRMAPGIALVLPLYMFFQTIGLLGTVWAVMISHTTFNLALVIYLMRNFFDDIPKALDEAALTDGAGPDVVIEATGVPASLENAVRLIAAGGRIVQVGISPRPARITVKDLTDKEIELHGSRNSRGLIPDGLAMLARHPAATAALLTHRFPFSDLPEAFRTMADPSIPTGKILVLLSAETEATA